MSRRHRGRKPFAPLTARAPRRTVPASLVFIIIAYLVIAGAYAATVPLERAPDESAHLLYASYVADNHRLPVFHPREGSYEFHQAPLYYAAAAPAYLAGRAIAPGREYLAVRLFGLLLGLALICATFALARDWCPGRPALAVGAAGFAAFLPMQIALSAAVNNDAALEALFAAGLWQTVVAVRDGWTRKRIVAVGALCGLAVLAKSSGIILLAAAWFALLSEVRQVGWARTLGRVAGVSGLALAICGWWLGRNWALYGDPLASRALLEAFALHSSTPASLIGESLSAFNYVLWVVGWTFASFWGVFGSMDVFMPLAVYGALAALSAAVIAGAALEARDYGGWEPWRKRAAWALGAAALLVLAMFVRFNLSFFQAQGRYLLPVLPVIATCAMAGWGRLFPESRRRAAYIALWVGMMLLSAAALPIWILPRM